MSDPTRRFSTRVENYVRFRPGYPEALVPLLEERGTLRRGDRVADVGCGTGLLARRFLERGWAVAAVEPNDAMRATGERSLANLPGCRWYAGRAEATGIGDGEIDLVAAAQAFHWFEPGGAIAEFRRILRRGGRFAFVWNVRDEKGDAFMREYEALLAEHGSDYRNVGAHGIDAATRRRLFGPAGGGFDVLPNGQRLDFDGLLGRVLSASYAPERGSPGHAPMVRALRALFDRHARDGAVTLRYRTEVYHGEAVT